MFSSEIIEHTGFLILLTLNNGKPNRFLMNYSLIGGEGDGSLGAADFGTKQFGFMFKTA
jgi:hypothetical protein